MEQSTVSQDLFDKIRSRFEGMQMADANAKTTLDPTEAKFFTFEVNTGEVSVSIADSKSMKVFYAKDITDGMTEEEALAHEFSYGWAVFTSEDAKEGPRAFSEKRTPNFRKR